MRYLAIDLGHKTLGLAVSDAGGIIANGLKTVRRAGESKDFEALAQVVREYEVEEVVVGLPLRLDDSRGPQALKAEAFAELVRARLGLPVHLWDERMSTVAAERALLEADLSRRKRKAKIDRVAAAIFLQSFLDARAEAKPKEEKPS